MKKKLFLIVAVICAMSFLFPANALAYKVFGKKLTYGVGNYGKSHQYYWVDSSATAHLSAINTAMSRWVNTTSSLGITTPISYKRTTTKTTSRMDFYKLSSVQSYWGITHFFTGSTSITPSSKNWVWARVRFTSDFAKCANITGVAAHEAGHGMGLAHRDNGADALMKADVGYGKPFRTGPRADDAKGINYLY